MQFIDLNVCSVACIKLMFVPYVSRPLEGGIIGSSVVLAPYGIKSSGRLRMRRAILHIRRTGTMSSGSRDWLCHLFRILQAIFSQETNI